MEAVLIALGNVFRRDDGAARRALKLLGPVPGAKIFELIQLAPEISEDIAGADVVVFLDADLEPGPARLEPAGPVPASPSPLAHALRPEEVVELSRRLFGFRGEAWLCRIPGEDFGEGEGLSERAAENARAAAALLRMRLAR
jgi:hydrogenase maturation protease